MSGVVIFLPETGIYPYLRTLCSIGKAISNKITLIHCAGQMQLCNMLPNSGDELSPEDKAKRCSECHRLFVKAQKYYNADSVELSKIITNEKLEDLKKIVPEKLSDLLTFNYIGFSFGKIAEIDLALATKFLNIQKISNKNINLYKKYILNALISAEVTNFICKNKENPIFLTFNPYTCNEVCRFFSKNNGVIYSTISNISYRGADYSKFTFYHNLVDSECFEHVNNYSFVKNIPLLKDYVGYSWSDSMFRFYGADGHIFSSKKTLTPEHILNKLALDKNKKTIVAFTSSNDEMIGINITYDVWNEEFPIKNIFKTQVEWIQFLQNYAKKHNDIQIIIRVHPREGSRQNGMPSEHLLLLQSIFTERTNNFVIVWADDPISSYDLIEIADLCLVNWSTMGQECARVGIPVLTYTSGAYYIDTETFTVAKSVNEYEKKLSELIRRPYTLDMLTDAVRYNYWRNHSVAIDCSDTIPHDFLGMESFFEISSEMAGVVKDICLGKTSAVEYNKKIWFDKITDNTEKEELMANLKGISDFFFRVFTAKTKQNKFFAGLNFLLRCVRKFVYLCTFRRIVIDISSHPERKKIHYPKCMIYSAKKISAVVAFFTIRPKFALLGKGNVQYAYNGKLYVRWSPLLYKLGTLYKNN